jgi:hypothetical protein
MGKMLFWVKNVLAVHGSYYMEKIMTTIRKLIIVKSISLLLIMKICPACETENEDQYIFCIGCRKPMPKQSHLENLMTLGLHEIKKKNFRKAVNYFDSILKLNIGDKEAWFLKGIALNNLKAGKEARECFKSAGVIYREQTCQACMGSKKCMSCDQTGVCYMCKGRRRCSMCRGTGECHVCGGVGCKMCRGTGNCVRCKGSGKCPYCEATGTCPDCNGIKLCGYCGGTGKSMEIKVDSVPKNVREFLKLKK